MALDEKQFAALARRFDFETWRDSNKLDTNLFIWNFFMVGKEFTGWSLSNIEMIQPRGEVQYPLMLSVWQKNERERLCSVSMRIHECPDLSSAHTLLLENLALFQSPNIVQLTESRIGDVVFGNPSRYTLLFARANMVVLMMNASRNLIPVDEFATSVDDYLAQAPANFADDLAPRVEPVATTVVEPDASEKTTWQLNVNEPSAKVWHKFFTTSGVVHQYKGQLHYHPDRKAESSKLRVFAISPGEGVGHQDLTIKGRPNLDSTDSVFPEESLRKS